MACRFIGAKPLSETMLEYSQIDPKEQTSGTQIEIQMFSFTKWV